jgi:dipeptidyl aminopeptidase/acylaminoacyl peptidase
LPLFIKPLLPLKGTIAAAQVVCWARRATIRAPVSASGRPATAARQAQQPEYGHPEHDAEFLRAISPVHQTDRIRAPLLVSHGANDSRVPVEHSERVVAALRARGAPVRLLRLENEGHGLERLESRLRAYGAAADFLAAGLER